MSGLGLVLHIAKSALNAQQYGMDVTGHNIANVNTPGYSRQSPVHEAKEPARYGGVLLGRGVDTTQVMRTSDQLIENRLMQQNSNMSCSEEMERYMQVVEGYFNENSESSLSTMLTEFWNLWHDVANNPSGSSERIALYEQSRSLVEQFNTLNSNLTHLETDLTNAVSAGIGDINQITKEIAQLNNQIVGMEARGMANDLRDERNTLISELSEHLNVKTFDQDNGSVTVVTARGCVLVHGGSSYDLELGGENGDRVKWQGSSTTTDITDYIDTGKLGGWLDMRDEIIAKYKLDLDSLAKEFIWAVNQQHSQGVGLDALSAATGTYQAADETAALDSSGLAYADKIVDGSFQLWVYDEDGYSVANKTIEIDADDTQIDAGEDDDIAKQINDIGDDVISATTSDGKLQIDAVGDYTFAFSDDTSNVLAALGINTFFTGSTAGDMEINDTISSDTNNIAAAQIDSDTGDFAVGDNSNALAIADLQYTSTDISEWTCDRINGSTEGTVAATIEDYYHSIVGSIGIKSASITRGKEFNEVMVNQLSEIRDGISAVSLDEEMTNLIKFQRAYGAAAKLISVSDEMLDTLLSVK
ncbi:MAG: flagellar hook-associated protein FlgK [Thermodesulfobacteriota bacterium]